MILGAMRAGLCRFPSPPAHMPQESPISSRPPKRRSSLPEGINFSVQFIPIPSWESILPKLNGFKTQPEHRPLPHLKPMSDDTIVSILHSSGSTGMPRPVRFHLEEVFKSFINQPFGWMYAQDVRFGTMALPTFHAMGMFIQVLMPLYAGYTRVLFAPGHIPVAPNPNLTIEAAVSTKCAFMMCVPAFLEAWSQDKRAVAHLRQMRGIMYGGGPLADGIGSTLAEQGVRAHCCYGATEIGHVHEIWDWGGSSDWGYIKFSSHVDARFIPQNDVDQTFELAFVALDNHRPFVLNSELDGKPAYRAKDLVVRHPLRPNLWKITAIDGFLTMEVLDDLMTKLFCSMVRKQIPVPWNGVLIELEESANDLYRAEEECADAVEEIWPFIERANQTSPTHSRLEKQAVIIVNPACPLPRTPKDTISRLAAFKLYERDIEAIYSGLKCSSATAGVKPHESWTGTDSIEVWISSLTATMLLRTIKKTLHQASKIDRQTIFSKPSFRQLPQLLACPSESGDVSADPVTEALKGMRAMIQKYDSNWSHQISTGFQPVKKERVVVKGTTGALGSHLFAQLLESDKVDKVWAMNRRSTKGPGETDLFVRGQAVRSELTGELKACSFEPNIHGTGNLLNLAFRSTAPTGSPRFIFASSISIAGFAGHGRRLREVPVALEDAATSIGYGQSKLVAEKLLESARRAGLQTCIIRLGQLTGDVKSRSWSITDWVPSLIGSSISVGYSPDAIGTVSWLPLDVAARSIIDTSVARNVNLPMVVHASHPHPVPWMRVIRALSVSIGSRTGSELHIVRFDEWNKQVAKAAAAFTGSGSDRYKRFPSTKIQCTVDGMVQADIELRLSGDASNVESGGTSRLDTTAAEALSNTLKSTPELDMAYVEKWVEYWESRGLFESF
ncbi:hypothetical protein B0J17DRAFT_633963 [Rhizoctonia solani]|nr:hypothetical protein B0J17DRAFT_633963 [Rhizoctonia solani]